MINMQKNYKDIIQVSDTTYILDILIDIQDNEATYTYRTRNSANQYIDIEFYKYQPSKFSKEFYWSICLYVNKRSKGYEYKKQTGKAGIESLLVAKEILKYHINLIKEVYYDYNNTIYIWADDIRRFNAYKRGLIDLKFVEGNYKGRCLYKKIASVKRNG